MKHKFDFKLWYCLEQSRKQKSQSVVILIVRNDVTKQVAWRYSKSLLYRVNKMICLIPVVWCYRIHESSCINHISGRRKLKEDITLTNGVKSSWNNIPMWTTFGIAAHISNWLAVNRGCGALINGAINYTRLLPGVEWANIYHSYNLKDRLSRYLLQS